MVCMGSILMLADCSCNSRSAAKQCTAWIVEEEPVFAAWADCDWVARYRCVLESAAEKRLGGNAEALSMT